MAYIAGPPVTGEDFYRNQTIIEGLLTIPSNILLVGSRRAGKTSILKELEHYLDKNGHLGLFVDLNECETTEEFQGVLEFALEDKYYGTFLCSDAVLSAPDAFRLLKLVNRALAKNDSQLLLLLDEGEQLGVWVQYSGLSCLKKLKSVIDHTTCIKFVLAGATGIFSLNRLYPPGGSSPFLNSFATILTIPPLTKEEASNLIRQTQSKQPIAVPDEVIERICQVTNYHPFLIQLICLGLSQTVGFASLPDRVLMKVYGDLSNLRSNLRTHVIRAH